MQIPPTSAASQAASIAAQATAKESGVDASQATGAAAAKSNNVEKSNEANADRDAQGQGDGLPDQRKSSVVDELDVQQGGAAASSATEPVPPLDESTGHLDITA